MNMVEKVARAICAEHGYRDPYIDTTWNKYTPHARAAIEAMRGPTPEMNKAGYLAKDLWPNSQCDNQKELERSSSEPRFNAMVDAALSE